MIRFERKGNFMSVSKVKSEPVKQNPQQIGNLAAHILAYGLFVLYIVPVVLIIIFRSPMRPVSLPPR